MEPDPSLARAILEAAPDGLVAVDDSGRVAFVTPRAEAMFGYGRGELLGRPVDAFVVDRAAGAKREEDTRQPPDTLLTKPGLWGRRRDGSEFPIDVTIGSGSPPGGGLVIASVREATGRRADERAARDAEDQIRLALLFDQSPVGIILVHGVEGDRVQLNRRAKALFGRSLEHVGRHPDHVLRPDGRALTFEQLPGMRARRGEHVDGLELRLRQASGALIPVLVSAAPLVAASGAIVGAVVVLQDISTTKHAERLRAERSAVLSHELRAPLNTIALSSQLLMMGIKSVPERRAVAGRVQTNAQQMSRMIGDLTELSRLDAARASLSHEPVDVIGVARTSVQTWGPNAKDRPLELRAPAGELCVMGDAQSLERVVGILLTNAIQYGREGTPIVVEVAANGDAVTVAVTNHGDGIPADELPRILHRFERTERAKQTAERRFGLGLHIARELVEAQGGSIEVESTPGATTTFRFALPLA